MSPRTSPALVDLLAHAHRRPTQALDRLMRAGILGQDVGAGPPPSRALREGLREAPAAAGDSIACFEGITPSPRARRRRSRRSVKRPQAAIRGGLQALGWQTGTAAVSIIAMALALFFLR